MEFGIDRPRLFLKPSEEERKIQSSGFFSEFARRTWNIIPPFGKICGVDEYFTRYSQFNAYTHLGVGPFIISIAVYKELGFKLENLVASNKIIDIELNHGYLYLPETSQPMQQPGKMSDSDSIARFASFFHSTLLEVGQEPRLFLFIDDVSGSADMQVPTFTKAEYQGSTIISRTAQEGQPLPSEVDIRSDSPYDALMFEADLIPGARTLVRQLENNPSIRITGGVRKRLRGVELTQYLWTKGHEGVIPACEILDGAYQLATTQTFEDEQPDLANGRIILLPESYRKQQERVKQLYHLTASAEPNTVVVLMD